MPLVREDSVWIPAFSELQQSVTITGALAGRRPAAATVGGDHDGGRRRAGRGSATGTVASDEAAATRRLPFAQGDTVRTLLERVGGPGPSPTCRGSYILRNDQVIPVDLYALVMLRDLKADRAVELGDTIVVPFQRESVLIEGAVFKPGPVPVQPDLQRRAVPGAGRRARTASPRSIDDVYLVTPNGRDEGVRPGPEGRARRRRSSSRSGTSRGARWWPSSWPARGSC